MIWLGLGLVLLGVLVMLGVFLCMFVVGDEYEGV